MRKILLMILLFVVIILSGCDSGIDLLNEKHCKQDNDCACGVHKSTKECFLGNKAFVDTSKQCPDFCTGIHGKFVIKCIDNTCKQTIT